jgi:hypothetical protein
MNNKKYTDFLENLICDLFDEIRDMSNSYRIDIDNGDSNYNYYIKEYREKSYNHYNKKGK